MQETITVDTQAIEKENKEIVTITDNARKMVIFNQKQYEDAALFLKKVKSKWTQLDTLRKSLTRPLDESKKRIMDLFRQPQGLLQEAEKIIKQMLITYSEEQDRLRREEQRKLELKAKAEEERKRKDLEERAEKWAAKGNDAKAEELQEQAEDVHVEAPVVAPKVEQTKGVSFREQWSAKVVDEEKVPREYLSVNIQALNKVAQATKGAIKIPGVEFKMEKILSSRG